MSTSHVWRQEVLIGDAVLVDGPFGPRRLVYADTTAPGRALSFIDDQIRAHVLPLYGNTQTEACATGLHTTALREDARRTIHRAVGGGHDDVVLFCGAGSTAKHAVFLSPDKFPGGPGTPGVLEVKRRLLRNRVPSVPGGARCSS
jgi:selenocysteine lyase/cysteine desulfurase